MRRIYNLDNLEIKGCILSTCGIQFVPNRSDQEFCSYKCYRIKYSLEHRESMSEYSNKWAKANPKLRREILHRYNTSESAKHRVNNWRRNSGWAHSNQHYYAKRTSTSPPLRLTREQWHDLLVTHNHSCVYCGVGGRMTQDHTIPISRGGKHTKDNVVPACLRCNQLKGNRPISELMRKLHD